MLQQFLFVGVGGSGGTTLRILRSLLLRRIREVGYEGFPAGWQFLWVDVPSVAQSHPTGADLPAGSYVPLVGDAINYATVDEVLMSKGPDAWRGALGWRPDRAHVHVPITAGAGQFRALGRMIAASNLDLVADRLELAIGNLTGVKAAEDLQRLGRHLGVRVGDDAMSPQVVVISSLAGGSGSGAFLDVCDVLRHLTAAEGWGGESVGILYSPDVFNALHPDHRKGIQGNALAALSELLNGYWHDELPQQGELGFLRVSGVAVSPLAHRGPRYPFVVGAGNGSLTLTEPEDVFRAVARALTAWTLSPQMQDEIRQGSIGNWEGNASSSDTTGLSDNRTPQPLASLGYASVALGRDRFADYAAERLAGRAVDRVLRAHWSDQDEKEEAALGRTVGHAIGRFLAESGLDERGAEHSQILDALRDPGTVPHLQALKESIVAKVEEGGVGKPAWVVDADVTERIKDNWNRCVDDHKLAHQHRAKEWVDSIQGRLLAHTQDTLATWGLPVTLRLLSDLAGELDAVVPELREDAARVERLSGKFAEAVSKELSGFKEKDRIQPGHPATAAAASSGLQGLWYKIEAELRTLAADLVSDFKTGYLLPLRDALARGGEALVQDERRPRPGVESKVERWSGEEVPRRLRPAANEFLVDPVSSYPALFAGKVHATVDGAVPEDSLIQAVSEIVAGRTSVESFATGPLEQTQTWMPARADCRPKDASAPRPAAFEVRLDADALLARARAWIGREKTPIGRYVHDSLASYLDPAAAAGPAEAGERLARFRDCFLNALDMSAPLVRVNNKLLARIQGVSGGPQFLRTFSALPFREGTPAYKVALELLVAKGEEPEDAARRFTSGVQSRIEMTTLLAAPYHPVVFDSLMAPIADEWSMKQTSADERAKFWRWRRARPLDEFVPVPPRVLLALVRGWFTARLLDRITGDGISTPLAVKIPGREEEPAAFPFPLLGPPPVEAHEQLPAILESLPLALVDYRNAYDEATAAYVALLDLGKGGLRDSYGTYETANHALVQWVHTASRGLANGTSDPIDQRGRRYHLQKRKEQLLARIERFQTNYAELIDAPVGDPRRWPSGARCREIGDQIHEALEQLHEAVAHMPQPQPATAVEVDY